MVTTWTGELNPGPASAAARSVATRTSEFAGSSSRPRLNVVMASRGEAMTSITAAPATSETTGRRITPSAQRSQKTSLPSSPVPHGRRTRKRSTRVPATARSAGRSVVEASTETETTTMAPIASERIPFTGIANRPASDTATVAPLKTTAVPELESARARASCSLAPSRNSRRKRLTMNSE